MIYNGDCLKLLNAIGETNRMVQCVIADPPDNLGLDYDGFIDDKSDLQYYGFLRNVICSGVHAAKHFWLSYYWKHDLEISEHARFLVSQYKLSWKKYIWRYQFGQYQEGDCPNGHRVILRLSHAGCPVNTSASGFRVESERQKMGDRRAAGLRVPDDVWEFPRITGNHSERRDFHPTQHPEGIYTRIIRMSTEPSDTVIDLFGGTGTLLRAGKHLPDRKYLVAEQSAFYCSKIAEEHNCKITTDSIEALKWLLP